MSSLNFANGIAVIIFFLDVTFWADAYAVSPSCGRQVIRAGRIVGGDDAYDGEFPWMVSLMLQGTHYCGASLIDTQWALTAGHCVQRYPPSFFKARLGEFSLSGKESNHSPVDVAIEKILPHPNYSTPFKYYNDIALLKLVTPVKYTDYVQRICLPEVGPENTSDYRGKEAIVAGWGWTGELKDGGKRADILQKVTVPVIETSQCQEWYKAAGKSVVFQASQMCAGIKEGKKDSCQGDSGGPLMLKDVKDKFVQIGVVSAGIGCARELLPGLYTRVMPYLPWIRESIERLTDC